MCTSPRQLICRLWIGAILAVSGSVGWSQAAQEKPDVLQGKRFQSLEKLERGLGPNGVVLDYWHISFKDGKFSWAHSDVSESGRYEYDSATGKITASPRAGKLKYEGKYDPKTGALIWQDKKYKEVQEKK